MSPCGSRTLGSQEQSQGGTGLDRHLLTDGGMDRQELRNGCNDRPDRGMERWTDGAEGWKDRQVDGWAERDRRQMEGWTDG